MKIASTIARYLLGTIFFVFGLNGFLHFLPSPPPPGIAGQGLPLALVVGVLWFLTALSVRTAFLGILQQRATS
jgi:hypothetical protein